MSVIAKMKLDGALDFANGALSKLSCVCENDLMAAYAKSDEDRLFTKYSPWGEMKLGHKFVTDKGNTKFQPGQAFYVVALRDTKKPTCSKAEHVHPVNCRVIHDFGTSKQVEVVHDAWPTSSYNPKPEDFPGELHWRMTIDNPPAVAFFEPGKSGYWIAFYDADKYSIHQALADAHSMDDDDA